VRLPLMCELTTRFRSVVQPGYGLDEETKTCLTFTDPSLGFRGWIGTQLISDWHVGIRDELSCERPLATIALTDNSPNNSTARSSAVLW
jgi:hypothetical protein